MIPTFSDYRERRQIIRQTFPDDLLEDLKDSEPELYHEAFVCDMYLSGLKTKLQSSVCEETLLPSLLTQGWDKPKKQKFSKNWADMENLLKLYAIGLYFRSSPLTQQAIHDYQELSFAAQQASTSPKNKKGIPAEQRLQKAGCYLAFGLKTLDAVFQDDAYDKEFALNVLCQEIQNTRNEYHAEKLSRSHTIALRVAKIIHNRYKQKSTT